MPYFDHNATTPLSAAAREAWLKMTDEHWQNPSSPYRDAAKTKIRLETAHIRLAEFLGCKSEAVVFNSGATEGMHSVIAHLAAHAEPSSRLAVNRTEHPATLGAAELYFRDRIVWLDTDQQGRIAVDTVANALSTAGLVGVVVMAANNETGTIQPWSEISALCQNARVPFVCDASQWLGKLPASGLGRVDWVIGAGHKFGGPKGVGFVKIADQAKSFRAQPGGEQEAGHRGGTENLPSIAALVAALTEAEQKKVFLETERSHWRESFERDLEQNVPGVIVVSAGADRLWNTVSVIMPHGENHRWVAKLDKLGFQVSTGSACATGKEGPSHVLSAMGYSAEEAKRVLRLSSGWETTQEEWQALLAAILQTAPSLSESVPNVVSPR